MYLIFPTKKVVNGTLTYWNSYGLVKFPLLTPTAVHVQALPELLGCIVEEEFTLPHYFIQPVLS